MVATPLSFMRKSRTGTPESRSYWFTAWGPEIIAKIFSREKLTRSLSCLEKWICRNLCKTWEPRVYPDSTMAGSFRQINPPAENSTTKTFLLLIMKCPLHMEHREDRAGTVSRKHIMHDIVPESLVWLRRRPPLPLPSPRPLCLSLCLSAGRNTSIFLPDFMRHRGAFYNGIQVPNNFQDKQFT